MGSLKTKIRRTTGLITLFLGAFSAPTAALALSDLERDFAYCTGRLSAELEHLWLFSDPHSDQMRLRRDAMADLLFAVLAPQDRRSALDLRISAKMAHATLLTQASFATSQTTRAHARQQASHKITTCVSLLLS